MRIQTILTAFFLMLSAPEAFSQKVEYAPPDKTAKRFYSKVIGQNDAGIFVIKSYSSFDEQFEQLRFRDNRVELAFMDHKLNNLWTAPLLLPESAEIQHVLFIRNAPYISYVLYNKEMLKKDLYLQAINPKNGNLDGSPLKIDELQHEKKKSRGDFLIGLSKNHRYMYVFHKVSDGLNKQSELSFKVYDSTLTLAWERSFQKMEDINGIKNVILDNEGNFYVLNHPGIEDDRAGPGVIVWKASANGSELKEFFLNFDNIRISDAQLALDQLNRKAVLAGFYSSAEEKASEGIVFGVLDMDKEELIFKSSESLKNAVAGAGRGINRGGELINYYIDQLILRNDGGIVLVAESNFVTESSNYNTYYQLYTTSYTYHYDNVLVLSVNPDGKIDWEGVIRKNQTSENDDAIYSSFVTSVYQDKIHMIFNKTIRKRSDIISYSISNKGSSNEKVLLSSSEEVLIMPQGGKQVSENELIIPCIKKNKPNFIKVTF